MPPDRPKKRRERKYHLEREPGVESGQRLVLDVALRLIAKKGPIAMTLSDIAAELEVSRAAPLHYFKNKRVLFGTIAGEGFDELNLRLLAASERSGATQEKLEHAARAFLHFALDPKWSSHFRVMFRPELFEDDDLGLLLRRVDAVAILRGLIEEALPETANGKPDSQDLLVVCWGTIHGLASLILDGSLRDLYPPSVDLGSRNRRLIDLSIDVLMKGIGVSRNS